MEENGTTKLELNTKMLENFEKIMTTKLDEVEELKVTELDKGSKLVNIISLCANVKTLIIEADARLNADKILANLFKPENLENLVLNNVKLPGANTLKRFPNLKMVSLNGVRSGHISDFFDAISNPENIEIISITNTDMTNCSVTILKKFKSLKYLKLENLKNVKFDNLKFLKSSKKLLKISIEGNAIGITQLDNLINSKCEKNIVVDVEDQDGKLIPNCQLKMNSNTSEITVLVNDLENFAQEVSLYKIRRINVIVNEKPRSSYFIQFLKSFGSGAHILLNSFSYLSVEQAEEIRDELKLGKIEYIDEKGIIKWNINLYIQLLTEIEAIAQKISNHVSKPEKFFEIYQALGKEFTVSDEDTDFQDRKITPVLLCQLLKNCLDCVDINSNIIIGKELEEGKKHYWNQVELDGKWYNVDLALDAENIKKNKVEYCLLGDKEFLQTHKPKSGKNNYCAEDFNPKLVNVFFKTGLFKENLFSSYIELMIAKIKKLFQFNHKKAELALPEANLAENTDDEEE